MSLALPTEIGGFMGSGRDRRRDEMGYSVCRTSRLRTGAERAARIERYRRNIEAGNNIRFIPASVVLTGVRRSVDDGPTA